MAQGNEQHIEDDEQHERGEIHPAHWRHIAPQRQATHPHRIRLRGTTVESPTPDLQGVFAKLSIEYDYDADLRLRWGYQKLLNYFRTSAPKPGHLGETVFNEDDISYLTDPGNLAPCPHWCGIFALWAIKTAGMSVGTWVVSKGISVVSGFSQINASDVDKGDVGYVDKPFNHHFIIDNLFTQGGIMKVNTIEGNSSPSSNFSFKTRDVSSISGFYSIFH